MAIKSLYLECDYCERTDDDYEEEIEALEDGWIFVTKADMLGEREDAAYCCQTCLEADL